jgi:hypothetical protein
VLDAGTSTIEDRASGRKIVPLANHVVADGATEFSLPTIGSHVVIDLSQR